MSVELGEKQQQIAAALLGEVAHDHYGGNPPVVVLLQQDSNLRRIWLPSAQFALDHSAVFDACDPGWILEVEPDSTALRVVLRAYPFHDYVGGRWSAYEKWWGLCGDDSHHVLNRLNLRIEDDIIHAL